jgi:chaperonin GroEL
MQEIYFKEEFKDKLISGINKLRDAVASTMGPEGKTVIITDEYGKPYITKDGVSVAKAISFKDPIENAAAIMIKEVAEKTADEAGDGTTTAIVLASAFINNLKDFNSKEVIKAFDEIIPKVIEQLKLNSRELKHEDIKHVASISANNDVQIGDIIQQAYNHSDIVKVEESNNNEDIIELITGMKLDVSYFSKHFITDERKGLCNMDNPYVLLLDGKIEDLKVFKNPLEKASSEGRNILIITEHISDNVLRLLESNVLSGNIKLCAIRTPGFAQHRKDLIKDLSFFTGAKIVNDFTNLINNNVLGILDSVKIGKNSSLLIKSNDVNIEEYISELKELTKDKDPLSKIRYENLNGKAAVIKVGGGSELEMKERKDRYDDAVLAVACALEEGIIEGGGVALYKIYHNFMDSLQFDEDGSVRLEPLNAKQVFIMEVYNCLSKPFYKIKENGTNLNNIENMFNKNIIDPFKVARCALENAASIAKTILSTETIILSPQQWN